MIEGSLDLSGARAVLDIGGGTGPLLAQLLSSQPTLTGAVLDLAEARTGALATFAEAGIADRAEFVAGDFFESIPNGFDVHLMTAVLHDWSDDDCVRILRNAGTRWNRTAASLSWTPNSSLGSATRSRRRPTR